MFVTVAGILEILTTPAATGTALNAKLLPKNAGLKTRKVICSTLVTSIWYLASQILLIY